MTDKVQKIRDEVVRMHNLLPVMDGDNISVNYADRICTTLEMYIDSLQEMPVSEDLEKAAEEYAYTNWASDDYHEGAAEGLPFDAIGHTEKCFKAGAKWQKEQFEKNRLAACDRQTEKEAERESDFIMGIIEKENRKPTFDDAIKYGMNLQKEQMMAKAIDAHCFDHRHLIEMGLTLEAPEGMYEVQD